MSGPAVLASANELPRSRESVSASQFRPTAAPVCSAGSGAADLPAQSMAAQPESAPQDCLPDAPDDTCGESAARAVSLSERTESCALAQSMADLVVAADLHLGGVVELDGQKGESESEETARLAGGGRDEEIAVGIAPPALPLPLPLPLPPPPVIPLLLPLAPPVETAEPGNQARRKARVRLGASAVPQAVTQASASSPTHNKVALRKGMAQEAQDQERLVLQAVGAAAQDAANALVGLGDWASSTLSPPRKPSPSVAQTSCESSCASKPDRTSTESQDRSVWPTVPEAQLESASAGPEFVNFDGGVYEGSEQDRSVSEWISLELDEDRMRLLLSVGPSLDETLESPSAPTASSPAITAAAFATDAASEQQDAGEDPETEWIRSVQDHNQEGKLLFF